MTTQIPAQVLSVTGFVQPPLGFFKWNFGAESKGNPSPKIFGALLRYDRGRHLVFTTRSYRNTTINVEKFMALLSRLILSHNMGTSNIHIT